MLLLKNVCIYKFFSNLSFKDFDACRNKIKLRGGLSLPEIDLFGNHLNEIGSDFISMFMSIYRLNRQVFNDFLHSLILITELFLVWFSLNESR